jgi:hypothetical protein
VALACEGEGALDLLAVDGLGSIGLVLLDHREEITEERPLVRRQLARDRVGPGRAGPAGRLPDAGVAAALDVTGLEALGKGPVLGLAGYACCALLRRNRMASWCLARQAA